MSEVLGFMKEGLPTSEHCEYMHRAWKLTASAFSYHAIHVRHGKRYKLYIDALRVKMDTRVAESGTFYSW